MENDKCVVCNGMVKSYFNYIFQCSNCGLFSSNLQSGIGRGIEGLEQLRKSNFRNIIELLQGRINQDSVLLEIGSGDGWFLDVCAEYKVKCKGIEPYAEEDLIRRHPEIYQIEFPVKEGQLGEEKFDAIIFNDVLEHIKDLSGALSCCKKLLKPEGLLIINIPNSNGIIYRLALLAARLGLGNSLDRLWQKDMASPHVWYFNDHNLKTLVGNQIEGKLLLKTQLKTTIFKGLWDRISSNKKSVFNIFIYLIAAAITLASRFLPNDIMLHVYQINKTENKID